MDASWITVVKRPTKSYKDNDFYTATWNVIHLYRVGMLKQNWYYSSPRGRMEGKWSVGYMELHTHVQCHRKKLLELVF